MPSHHTIHLVLALAVGLSGLLPAHAAETKNNEGDMLTSVLGRGFGTALKATARFRVLRAEDQATKGSQQVVFARVATIDGEPLKAPRELHCDFFDAQVRERIMALAAAGSAETAVIGYETVVMEGMPLGIDKYLKPDEWEVPAMEGWHATPTFVVVAVVK